MTPKHPKHVITAADAIVARAAIAPADTARANLVAYALTVCAHACLVCGGGYAGPRMVCVSCDPMIRVASWWELASYLCPASQLRTRQPLLALLCHLHGVDESSL